MSRTRTLGIDLASADKKTAACLVEWSDVRASVVSVELGLSNDSLVMLAASANQIAVDIPFGWPNSFVEAIQGHSKFKAWPAADLNQFRFRKTDLYVQAKTKCWPLSVSSDRIAIPAMRAARLLPLLAGRVTDRSGLVGNVVEAYPAASLRRWKLPANSYKGDEREQESTRKQILDGLLRSMPGAEVPPEIRARFVADHDVLDAFICALVARAHALGFCDSIPDSDLALARVEGWIALPTADSLGRLVSSAHR